MTQNHISKLSKKIALAVIILSGLILLGIISGLNLVSVIFPNYHEMRLLTAFLVFMLSTLVLIHDQKKFVLSRIISSMVLCFGFVSAYYTYTSINLTLFQNGLNLLDSIRLNEVNSLVMLPLSVLSILLLSKSLLLFSFNNNKLDKIAQWLILTVFLLSFVVFLDYIMHTLIQGNFAFNYLMSFSSSILFILLSVASSMIKGEVGIIRLFTSQSNGAKMGKRLFGRLFFIMMLLTYLRIISDKLNIVSVSFGIILFVSSFLIVALLLIWKAASELNKVQSEKSEIEEELYFQNVLIDAIPDPMLLVDKDGIIKMANIQLEKVFGYIKEELIGKSVEIIIPDRFKTNHSGNITSFFKSPSVRSMGSGLELFALRKDNTELSVEVSLSPLIFGNEQLVVASIRDISERKKSELDIINLNKRLQLANSTSQTGIWEYDVIENKLIWDDIMYHLYDVEPTTFNGIYDDCASRVHPHDIEAAATLLQNALVGTAEFDTEFRVIWRDKSIHHLVAKSIVERDSQGNPIKVIGTNQDITLKKEHEEITKKIEYQNRAFIEQTPTAIAMFDSNMRYIATSSKWMSDYGLEGRDIIGISHYEVFPEIGEEWKKIHKECLEGEIHRNDNDRFERADGSVQWLKWEDRPWYNIDGSIGGIIMYTEDISKQKKVEELLKISEKAFRGNFENAAIGMAILDENGKWQRVNKKVCEIVGYSAEELMHLTFQDITHPEDLDADLHLLSQLIAGEIDGYQMEKRYFHKNGKIVDIILGASVVKDDNGKVLYFIAQIIDITEHKKNENEIKHLLEISEEQNNRLKNFAHIVSHNLRSHSGNITNLVELFLEEHSDFKDNDYIKYLNNASLILNETIANLNEVALINTAIVDNLTKLDLYEYANKAMQSLSALALNENVSIINNIYKDTFVLALPAYLESILLNFISNAIKYKADNKDSIVELSAIKQDNYTVLQIKDNGLGIDLKSDGRKLFGMYKTFHEHKDSRGLGLFITKNQIEALGGKVEVESEVNIGTTFKVYLKHEEN